jgi:hypothetical protein
MRTNRSIHNSADSVCNFASFRASRRATSDLLAKELAEATEDGDDYLC